MCICAVCVYVLCVGMPERVLIVHRLPCRYSQCLLNGPTPARPVMPPLQFRAHIEAARSHGNTALYDALDTAAQALEEYHTEHQAARLRVLVLSDGADTSSKTPADAVARRLFNANVTVDSICIGKV